MTFCIFSVQATGDPYYLRVGQSIVEKLNAYARVPCGFAAVQDVRTGTHEDRYFVAEMAMKTCYNGNIKLQVVCSLTLFMEGLI